jgi:hypothetical protein
MKKSIYKSRALLTFCLCFLTLTVPAQEVTKEYHKEFTPGALTALEISNRYGDVVVHTWEKQAVVIHVKVLVEMPNRQRAEQHLGYIDVQFSETPSLISAKTVIDSKFNFSGWGSGSRRFRIDYTINMPYKMDIALANRYGDTDMDEVRGRVDLDIKYGNLNASRFTRGNEKPLNKLNLAYGKARIDEVGWMEIIARYSGSLEIGRSQALLTDSRYSKLNIGETSSIVAESKYDNIRIQNVNNLVIDAGYADIGIGTLTRKLKLDAGYGSITVDRVPQGFESLEVNSRYTGVRIGIDNSASYKLDAKVSYGGLRFNEANFQHQRRIVQNNMNETSGIVGNESSPTSSVYVNSSYGSIRLN